MWRLWSVKIYQHRFTSFISTIIKGIFLHFLFNFIPYTLNSSLVYIYMECIRFFENHSQIRQPWIYSKWCNQIRYKIICANISIHAKRKLCQLTIFSFTIFVISPYEYHSELWITSSSFTENKTKFYCIASNAYIQSSIKRS